MPPRPRRIIDLDWTFCLNGSPPANSDRPYWWSGLGLNRLLDTILPAPKTNVLRLRGMNIGLRDKKTGADEKTREGSV